MYKSLSYEGGEEGWAVVVINVDDISWHTFPISDDCYGQPKKAATAIMECWLKLPEFQADFPFDENWEDDFSMSLHGDEFQRMVTWTPYRGEGVTFVFACD